MKNYYKMGFNIGLIESKKICNPWSYFVGFTFDKYHAANRRQIRIGFYWYHIHITWTTKKPS